MSASEIREAIERKVSGTKYLIWTIGITEQPIQRRKEHERSGFVTFWENWKADSVKVARNVEAYFLKKVMKGGTGGGDNPTYVYVF